MASSSFSSCSSSNPQWIYDVFLNFRGEDTRDTFVSHLHAALSRVGINTFIDYQLHKGTEVGPELFQKIEGSQMSLVVFSKTYTESSWCLKELIKIMECRRTYGQIVVPIFYHVDPSVVRDQKGTFGEALVALAKRKYSESEEEEIQALTGWRDSLTEAANLSGFDMTNGGNEADKVKEIVDKVLTLLDITVLPITNFPVGLDSRVHYVIELVEKQSSKVCLFGLWGMGGCGKTTTAKAIYNRIHRGFENRSCIRNIREVCQKGTEGHIYLQKKLLYDILKTKVKIDSIDGGITQIEKRLSGKRALIVLDDVDKFEQLSALCGSRNWIGKGSVIIITTRNRRLLQEFGVDHVYETAAMNNFESLELFSWHAFKKACPREGFTELSRKVVAYCGGLPLALEVLGSYLSHRCKQEWEDVLSKLKRIPNDKVQEKLRISYDGLSDDMEKNIFLDICCFFIGKDRAYVTEILKGCRLYAHIGIAVLVERSLVKIEKNNKLAMHDLLRDMGREVVRLSSTEKPEKRSRLWSPDDVRYVLTKNIGTRAIRGLALKLHVARENCFNAEAFKEMERLRLLQLDRVQLSGDYQHISKELAWVYWKRFPLSRIPQDFYLGKVVVIALKYSNLKIFWVHPQVLECLKVLDLSHSKSLTTILNLSNLRNLEKLILKDCPSLREIDHSIGDLDNLVLINLKDCTSLHNFPNETYKLKSVKTLILSGCWKIDKLEEGIVQMESLTTLIAENTALKQVPFSIVKSKSIGYISLCGYEGLARDVFPSIIHSWMSPTMNPPSHIHPWRMISPHVSMDVQDNDMHGLAAAHSSLLELRSVKLHCDNESQVAELLDTFLSDIHVVKFDELEISPCASQISEHSLRSYLIRIGSYEEVFNTLDRSILEGLTNNESCDVLLSGDTSYWLTHTSEGRSVFFVVPQDSNYCVKGMTLCVVYSSSAEKMAAECLTSVVIVNHTKCTIQIYKQDTVISFNDEDWQGMISNLGSGDKVEIFVTFGHGLAIKKTTIFLILGESTNVEVAPSPEPNENAFIKFIKKVLLCKFWDP